MVHIVDMLKTKVKDRAKIKKQRLKISYTIAKSNACAVQTLYAHHVICDENVIFLRCLAAAI